MMKPVFVSRPTVLSEGQESAYRLLLSELGRVGCEERRLGTTDYPTNYPLREVLTLARHCSGGLILGFSQFETSDGVWKRGTPSELMVAQTEQVQFPTPWNQLEAGVLFAIGLPLLVFRDKGISGGIFDNGVTDLFIHGMPQAKLDEAELEGLRMVFQKWAAEVSTHYYGEWK